MSHVQERGRHGDIERKSVMDNNENIFYFTSTNNTVDIVLLNKVNTAYPLHTHAEHYTMGIVVDGKIIIETDTDKYVCKSGGIFTIPIDVPHSIKPFSDCSYTMLSFCIHQDYLVHANIDNIKLMIDRKLNQLFGKRETVARYSELLSDGLILLLANKLKNITGDSYSKDIKHKLTEVPETSISIEDMSNEIYVSSFHMIRQFKKEVGLTPHQFQIQCRIRKAQKMLLSDKTIAEVACDLMKIGAEKGNCKELSNLCHQAYSDYKSGVISETAYSKIYAICMDYAYPR